MVFAVSNSLCIVAAVLAIVTCVRAIVPLAVTTCKDTTCDNLQTCRIVVENNDRFGPRCIDLTSLPKDGDSEACGTSGHPLLREEEDDGYHVLSGEICPDGQFVNYNKLCCADTDKPGTCPLVPLAAFLPGPEPCPRSCRADNECKPLDKCCPNACGGTACLRVTVLTCASLDCLPGFRCQDNSPDDATCEPEEPKTCKTMKCAPGQECRESPNLGAECVVPTSGRCPQYKCPLIPPEQRECVDMCLGDDNCPVDKKCCRACDGCRHCLLSFAQDICQGVMCPEGKTCQPQPVFCIDYPCDPVPACVLEVNHIGQCPTPGPKTAKLCKDSCSDDGRCGSGEKCCPTSCGGYICTPAVPLTSCRYVDCPKGETCREVSNNGLITPACRKDLPTIPGDSECSFGDPLLLPDESDVQVAVCGRALNRVDCPPGYHCVIDPLDRWSFCCKDEVPTCFPPCGPGERCDTNVIACLRPPCPPFPRCVIDEAVIRPGTCPPLGDFGICAFTCEHDGSCPGQQKCCETPCKGTTCADPQPTITCANVLCIVGTKCIEGDKGPRCVRSKSGNCPNFPCPPPPYPPTTCEHQCDSDEQCPGALKCCPHCDQCRACMYPLPPTSLCETVIKLCDPGTECQLQPVYCISPPCDPVPACVPKDKRPGLCPTPGSVTKSQCDNRCKGDTSCEAPGEKCCPTSCGGAACMPAVPLNSCDNVKCPENKPCREIYTFDLVTPVCMEDPPTFPQDDVCAIGLPLLQSYGTLDDLQTVSCGLEFDKVNCPPGYHCKRDPEDRWSVCCRDEEPSCYPPCGHGEYCDTKVIACTVPPCSHTPRCEVKDKCLLPKVVGPCEALIPRFYYNYLTKQCTPFDYGECDGNENNFDTEEECQKACEKEPTCDPPCGPGEKCDDVVAPCQIPPCPVFSQCVVEDLCRLPKVVGPCDGTFPRFYYDFTTNQCTSFDYGGCNANKNNFLTEEDCRKACVKEPVCDPPCGPGESCEFDAVVCKNLPCAPTTHCVAFRKVVWCSDRCQQPTDTGLCKAAMPRFYFDTNKKACKSFIYGGCGGNQNNFMTKVECEEACLKKLCLLPKDAGPCKGSFQKVYYDANAHKCKTFIYGGCEGNANRFPNMQRCSKKCRRHLRCPSVKPSRCSPKHHECSIKKRRPCKPGLGCCKTPCGRRCVDLVWY